MKSLHTKAVSDYKSLISHNRLFQTASPQTAPKEANLPRPYRTTLSHIHSSFCSSLHSYRQRIGLIPSSFCGVKAHTTVHVFSCSSHLTPLTELNMWERPRLASEFLSVFPFFDLLPLPPPSSGPPPYGRQES